MFFEFYIITVWSYLIFSFKFINNMVYFVFALFYLKPIITIEFICFDLFWTFLMMLVLWFIYLPVLIEFYLYAFELLRFHLLWWLYLLRWEELFNLHPIMSLYLRKLYRLLTHLFRTNRCRRKLLSKLTWLLLMKLQQGAIFLFGQRCHVWIQKLVYLYFAFKVNTFCCLITFQARFSGHSRCSLTNIWCLNRLFKQTFSSCKMIEKPWFCSIFTFVNCKYFFIGIIDVVRYQIVI